MTARARWLILVFALIGLGFASTSTWVHYHLMTDPTYVSPCDVSATFNCTQAYLSQYGSVAGVPVAIAGVVWFVLVALTAAFARPDRPGGTPGPSGSYIFGLATIGLAVILYLGYASWRVLHTYCILCMGTYASVIAIFITAGTTTSVPMAKLIGRIGADLSAVFRKPATMVTAILFLGTTAVGVATFPRTMTAPQEAPPPVAADEEARFEQLWNAQPRINLGIPAGNAKVVIVKFNDWLCGGCKAWALSYEPLLKKYESEHPGAVKYVVKDWPWNSGCNYTVPQTFDGHQGSCDAAVAVRAARDRGKEGAMVQWLFDNQELLIQQGMSGSGQASKTIRAKAAEMLGISDFDREVALKVPEIRKDVADGASLQVSSTPTFFVNGVRTTSQPTASEPRGGANISPQYLDMAIKLEIRKNGGSK